MANDALVVWDEANRELRNVPEAFAAHDRAVLSFVWRRGIDPGVRVEEGTELCDVQWDDNTRQALVAPAGCVGEVAYINRNLLYETLHMPPSKTLLRLV